MANYLCKGAGKQPREDAEKTGQEPCTFPLGCIFSHREAERGAAQRKTKGHFISAHIRAYLQKRRQNLQSWKQWPAQGTRCSWPTAQRDIHMECWRSLRSWSIASTRLSYLLSSLPLTSNKRNTNDKTHQKYQWVGKEKYWHSFNCHQLRSRFPSPTDG